MFVTACLVTSRLVTSSASFEEIVIDTYSENVSLYQVPGKYAAQWVNRC